MGVKVADRSHGVMLVGGFCRHTALEKIGLWIQEDGDVDSGMCFLLSYGLGIDDTRWIEKMCSPRRCGRRRSTSSMLAVKGSRG